jgi:hypothetical protein
MKSRTFSMNASATLLALASACSGFDQMGDDETILEPNEPTLSSDQDKVAEDEAAFDSDETSPEPVIGSVQQAYGARKVNATDNRPFGGNIFAENFPYIVGGDCSPGHVRSGTPQTRWTSQVGGHCVFERWVNSGNISDCRAHILAHTAGGGFGGNCLTTVFEELGLTFSFGATTTADATTNTTNRGVFLEGGQTLTVGTCGMDGASFNGDTFLRVFDPRGIQVAANDDACAGLGSQIAFTAGSAGTFEVRAGCFGNRSCTGTVVVR